MSIDIKQVDELNEDNIRHLFTVGVMPDGTFATIIGIDPPDPEAHAKGEQCSICEAERAWVSLTLVLVKTIAAISGASEDEALSKMQMGLIERLIHDGLTSKKVVLDKMVRQLDDEYDPFTPNHKMH